MDKPETKMMGTVLPKLYADAVQKLIRDGKYLSESEFIRQAIVEKLTRDGALNES
jgi:Arc/MetJ-type ribon-helix-helix transcriptional regulator